VSTAPEVRKLLSSVVIMAGGLVVALALWIFLRADALPGPRLADAGQETERHLQGPMMRAISVATSDLLAIEAQNIARIPDPSKVTEFHRCFVRLESYDISVTESVDRSRSEPPLRRAESLRAPSDLPLRGAAALPRRIGPTSAPCRSPPTGLGATSAPRRSPSERLQTYLCAAQKVESPAPR
jgi:hypothetical protein